MNNIANDESKNIYVIAPPGCGKTELLAKRANYLISTLEKNQKILALTFSNKARNNLDDRLNTVLGADRKRKYVTVKNFHGHASELIQSHGKTLGFPTDFESPSEKIELSLWNDSISEQKTAAEKDELKKIADEILSRLKRKPISDEQILSILEKVNPVAHRFEINRLDRNSLTYNDLLHRAQLLLRVPEIKEIYNQHYGAVLVDEFQDLSLQQLEISLRSSENRTFVGDPLQGIYTWAGADPNQVQKILRRLCGEPKQLDVSYRSAPNILKLLGSVSESMGGGTLLTNDSSRWFKDGVSAGARFPSAQQEAQYIADAAKQILDFSPEATIGVISRMNWRRYEVDQAFQKSSLPVKNWEKQINNSDAVSIIKEAYEKIGRNKDLDLIQKACYQIIGKHNPHLRNEAERALEEFSDLARQTGDFEEAFEYLSSIPAEEDLSPGVHLLTAHAGKGLQFDWVFVPGVEDGHIPSFLAETPEQREEEKRILLVIISRAKYGIFISRAERRISLKNGKPYTLKNSPFASLLSKHLSRQSDFNKYINEFYALDNIP